MMNPTIHPLNPTFPYLSERRSEAPQMIHPMQSFFRVSSTVLWLLLLLPWRLHAQSQEIRFAHLTVDDGLSHNSITSIIQDRKGFMWFGTLDGLNSYDGYRFTKYRHDPDDPGSLSMNWINALYEDHEGILWATTDQGLNRFDRNTQSFTHFVHNPDDPNSLSHNVGSFIFEDSRNTLWVGTWGGGLNRFDRNTQSFTHFVHNPDDPNSLGSNVVRVIYEDRSGTLWVGTKDGGLNRFDRDTQTFDRFVHNPDDPNSLSNNNVFALYEDRNGALWIGTQDAGLSRFDHDTQTFTHFVHNPDDPVSLSGNLVRAIYEDRSGMLWVGTKDGGLNRFDRDTQTFDRFVHNPSDPHSLSNNEVSVIYEDRFGTLWIGTGNGALNHFDLEADSFTHVQHDRHNPNSLNHNSVWALYEDPEQPSILWIGTAEGGLNRLDRSTATFTHFVHDPDDPSSLIHNFVEAVYRDREGVLWVGTRGGLDRMNRDGTSFTHYLNEHSNPAYTIVRVIYEAPSESGVLWLSQGLEGLIRLDLDTDTFTSFRHIPDHPTWITSILEDHEGTLWIGSDGNQEGLTRFDRDTETFTHFVHNPDDPNSLRSNSVYCLYEDEAGRLWIGTTGGLSRFDASTQTFTHYTVQNSELPNDVIYGILGDAEGTLWISTLGGLSKFDPLADTFHTYGVDRGLQGRAFNPFASYKNPRGELFFGGTNGFNAFFPGRIRENPYPPQVVVTTFELFNPSRSITEAEPHTIHLTMPDSITLSYGENDLYFEYVGLHYSNPDKNQYAYKLENFEDEWHYVGTQRTATYTSLEPGEYFFRVIASNSDGVWTEEAASVRVVIRPPWWMTGWAYTLYAFLFLAGVFATDRIQRARLIRKERERTQILEAELRAEAAELQAEKAELQAQAVESEARALRAENARKEHELENARELEKAYQTLKATQAQLIQSEKMASLGQLTAGIAHEIKNPLNFVNNFAELCMELAEELDEEIEAHRDAPLAAVAGTLKSTLSDLKINAEQINKHGKRADGIVKSMLMHSRGTPGERGLTDVNQLLEEYVNLSYHGMRANQIGFNATLEQEYDEAVGEVSLVPQDIGRVFINLLNNAFYAVHQKALSSGDAYEPTVSARTRKLERAVEIRIRDNGTGIPARIRRQIFQPFFTTKPTGTGTGLGLSLSYDIVVQGHGGTLDVESEDGQFTEFIITLPA